MKSILITGGSRGIGRATAVLAAKRGWNVALTYVRDEGAARRTAHDIEASGVKALCIQGDVGIEADVLRIFDATASLGPLTGVVINAGIVAPAMKLADMSTERLEGMFRTNVLDGGRPLKGTCSGWNGRSNIAIRQSVCSW